MTLLIGTGAMSLEYVKVLKHLGAEFNVVGRSKSNSENFAEKTGLKVVSGGVKNAFINNLIDLPTHAIIATGVQDLYSTAKTIIQNNVKNVLIEKPGGLSVDEIDELCNLAKAKSSNVFIAYNRRFYSSVLNAIDIIREDGGVQSFFFDFTEWSHEISALSIENSVKERWILANSSHVIDLAFFLGGFPIKLQSEVVGNLSWHSSGSIFCGSGVSILGAPFCYHANWNSAGRWKIEICTKNIKLIFSPIEKLQIMKKSSISVEEINLTEEDYDKRFKPGLHKMVDSFLNGINTSLCTIDQQRQNFNFFHQIADYLS
jgi:predicted dehydrogenase